MTLMTLMTSTTFGLLDFRGSLEAATSFRIVALVLHSYFKLERLIKNYLQQICDENTKSVFVRNILEKFANIILEQIRIMIDNHI